MQRYLSQDAKPKQEQTSWVMCESIDISVSRYTLSWFHTMIAGQWIIEHLMSTAWLKD